MWLISRLASAAALVAAVGCGGIVAGSDNGTRDAGSECSVGCGCMTLTVTASQACQMIDESGSIKQETSGPTCDQVCPEGSNLICQLPQSYVNRVSALNADAPWISDGGLDCPNTSPTVTIMCIGACR